MLNKQDSNIGFDVNRHFLQEKYPSIRHFFRISCKTGQGIFLLLKGLRQELAQMEIISICWPQGWFQVKDQIEHLNKPYISCEEYGNICAEADISDEVNRETLVDCLNDLGVAIHFKDFVLDNTHVLDPVWVTQAVYKIITNKQIMNDNGFLKLESLKIILRNQKGDKHSYPHEKHFYILELMKKFELCYSVGEEAVLIPQLLPVSEPTFRFKQTGTLRFALHYLDFLPPSVFPRFMVKVHKDIQDRLCWRTGVLLEDKRSRAQALVKADIEKRQINLWVQGDTPREYLHYLRYTLADINSSFEKLTVSERVPMPDDPQVSADYETLLNLSEAGSDIFIPDGSKTRYSVRKLLGLVQPRDRDELAGLVRKVSDKADEELSPVGLLNEIVEPKITILGVTFNLKGFFDKILARQKQKRQQARK